MVAIWGHVTECQLTGLFAAMFAVSWNVDPKSAGPEVCVGGRVQSMYGKVEWYVFIEFVYTRSCAARGKQIGCRDVGPHRGVV